MNLETREEKRKRREPLLSRVPLLFLLSSAPSCVLTCEATKGVVSVEQKHSLPTSAAAVRRKDEKDSFFSLPCVGAWAFRGLPWEEWEEWEDSRRSCMEVPAAWTLLQPAHRE